MRYIYLDYNATAPLAPRVRDALRPYLDAADPRGMLGNPSSLHRPGQRARQAIARARGQVAAAIGAAVGEIVFTGGGTEATNLALRGAVAAGAARGARHVVTTTVEHPATLRTVDALEASGVEVTRVAVDRHGRVAADAVLAAITPETAVVSVMLANNDIGTLQPVGALGAALRARPAPRPLLHCDAVQALGKVAVDVGELGVDLLSLSGHKIGAPSGTGALYAPLGRSLVPQLTGGAQERGRRAGTENLLGIVGFGEACAGLPPLVQAGGQQLAALRDAFEAAVCERFPGARINGHPTQRLPNTSSVTLPGIDGAAAVAALDLAGIAASTGSACSSGTPGPSHVLTAIGLSEADARATLRFSFGPGNTPEDIPRVVAALADLGRGA